ncbi:MAG: S8 family serine peptidase, partial [Bacteroidota bacterium]
DIRLAIVDGPTHLDHPALRSENLKQKDIYGADHFPVPSDHGTHVSSIIFGNHDSPVKGIAPEVSGIIIPLFNGKAASQADLARAINTAIEADVHIINISAGELDNLGEPEPILATALRQCATQNILVIAAAGNDGCRCLHVPAAVPSVLTVGALDALGDPLPASNWGDAYARNGLMAPGKDINGALADGGYGLRSGTSFATPYVSGLAALLLSLQQATGAQASPHQIKSILLETALPCPDKSSTQCARFLRGVINPQGAYAALVRHLSATQTPTDHSLPSHLPSSLFNINTSSVMEKIHDTPAEMEAVELTLSEVSPTETLAESTSEPLIPANSLPQAIQTAERSPSELKSAGVLPSCGCGGNETKSDCSCGSKSSTPASP